MKIVYIWKDGDCLKKIADMFDTTVEKIASFNHIENIDVLKKGDMLLIPSNSLIKGDISK